MIVSRLVELFLRWTSQNRSPATISFYRSRLARFLAEFGSREFETIEPLDLADFLWRTGEGQSDSTRRHNAVAIERLHGWALDHRILEKPLFRRLEKPRGGQRDRLPTAAETAAILRRASDAFRRMYSALRISGARPGELCRAQIGDWNRAAQVIVIARHKTGTKTGRPRRIPVGRKLSGILARAIGDRRDGPIFLTTRGGPWSPKYLSAIYSRLRRRAGLPADLCLYLARHEAGTRLVRTAGIEYARRMLGHASIQTTQRYSHLDDGEIAAAQDL